MSLIKQTRITHTRRADMSRMECRLEIEFAPQTLAANFVADDWSHVLGNDTERLALDQLRRQIEGRVKAELDKAFAGLVPPHRRTFPHPGCKAHGGMGLVNSLGCICA